MLATLSQETALSSGQDSSHLILIVQNIGIESAELDAQAVTLGSGDR